jgi:hypothetical protein
MEGNAEMIKRWLLLAGLAACCLSALADENTERKIAESALREMRGIISRGLFGHYDITELQVLKIEELRDVVSSKRDHGLASVRLKFAATRNATRSPNLNPAMFEPGSAMCQDWLYLHCGVPPGHVFEGKLEVLLALGKDGAWRAVPPRSRSRSRYPLDGYLLLEGREKEGYVVFPKR